MATERRSVNQPVRAPVSEALRDIHGLLFAVMPGNRYRLRGTARHIGSFRRRDSRRVSMCPIPGNIIGVMNIARWRLRLRNICRDVAVRWPVEVVPRPKRSSIVDPVMPQRPGKRWMGNRMRKRATSRCSRPGECFIRGKQNHEGAEGCDKRRIHSMGHGAH